MADEYYVQPQARRWQRCIHKGHGSGGVSPAFLQGLDPQDFWQAYDAVRDLLLAYYAQAEQSPAALDLPCYAIDEHRNTSPEARESAPALTWLAGTLVSLGIAGRAEGGALSVDPAALKEALKALRIKRLPQQVEWLGDHGFVFPEWMGKAFDRKAERLHVDFPDNPHALAVIAAMGAKASKHRAECPGVSGPTLLEALIPMDPALFADDTASLPPKTFKRFLDMIDAKDRGIARDISQRMAARGLALRYDGLYLKNRFHNAKGKDSLSHLEYGDYRNGRDGNETLTLRLKLNHPDAYIDQVAALPPHLKAQFADVWCGNCVENCNRRVTYTLEGEAKRACGCFAFAFRNPSAEDLDPLMALYDAEQEARKAKK